MICCGRRLRRRSWIGKAPIAVGDASHKISPCEILSRPRFCPPGCRAANRNLYSALDFGRLLGGQREGSGRLFFFAVNRFRVSDVVVSVMLRTLRRCEA